MVSAANSLARRGFFVAIAYRSAMFDGKLDESVRTIQLPLRHEVDLPTFFQLAKFIHANGISVIVPTKRKEYFIAGLLGKILRIPVHFRIGIERTISKFDLPQRFVLKYLPKSVIVNADAICKSLLLQNLVSKTKINVLYNGYDFEPLKGGFTEANLCADRFIFACAGRLSAQKGFDILLESVPIVLKTRRDFRIYIAGSGGERSVYEQQIAELKIQEQVTLLGEIKQVREFFALSDCAIIPSRAEGIPNTLFEAWSVGVPAIATMSSGIPEAITDGVDGLLCELNAHSLATAMLKALEHRSELVQMGKNGRSKLETQFSLAKMADGLINILRQS